MATASATAQKTAASIRAKANHIAKQKTAEAIKAMKERFKKAAPQLRADVVERFAIPGAAGIAGAVAADVVLDRIKPLAGAKGDIAKLLAGVTVGTLGPKVVKSPYIHHAAFGIVVVNGYKLVTRLTNRLATGQGLSGLLDDDSNADLIGAGRPPLERVNILLNDGARIDGYQDAAGNLYDASGTLIGPGNSQPALNALPSDDSNPALVAARQLSGLDEGRAALNAARSLG